MKTAIITGVSGQDGTYLAELLLSKNYRVIGTTIDPSKIAEALPFGAAINFKLIHWLPYDLIGMINYLSLYQPSEIYNLAALSSGVGMYKDVIEIGEVNGLAVARILEAIRSVDSSIRFCQASSREIFGEALESPQTENTQPNPRSPYGAAKLYADAMVKIYRSHYGMFACSAILYNHESPRRREEFVTRKITRAAAAIKSGILTEIKLGDLDARRDWGFAGDYMEAMWLMLQQSTPSDYIIASGEGHSVRDVCQIAFGHLGLDYQCYVLEDSIEKRPSEPFLLVGDIAKARTNLQWNPKTKFKDIICQMVEADLRELKSII
jgi:GDPmannose 4,6-dehydratase